MKISRKELRKMINEAFRGYQYASRDGSRYIGSRSHVFELKQADVRLLEKVILESLQASLKSGHQLGTAVHTAEVNIKQSNAILYGQDRSEIIFRPQNWTSDPIWTAR